MDKLNRRNFLKLVGAGSGVMAAAVMIPTTTIPRWTDGSIFTSGSARDVVSFRAVTGLPAEPLPAYATYVVEGSVNLRTGSGTLTKTLYAGPPEATSTVVLPGLSRVVRVTSVRSLGSSLEITGVIDESQLHPGESPTVSIQIDRTQGLAKAPFIGTPVALRL